MAEIMADSFGGLQAGIQNDRAMRQRALEVALNNTINQSRYTQQRQLNADEVAYRRNREMALDTERQQNAERAFKQNENWYNLQSNQSERGLTLDDYVLAAQSGEEIVPPNATPEVVQFLGTVRTQARRGLEANFRQVESAAAMANELGAKKKEKARLAAYVEKNKSRFLPNSLEVKSALESMALLDQEIKDMEPRVNKILGTYSRELRYDPETDTMSPAETLPWLETPAPGGPPGKGTGGGGTGKAPTSRSMAGPAGGKGAPSGEYPPEFHQAVQGLIARGIPMREAVARVLSQPGYGGATPKSGAQGGRRFPDLSMYPVMGQFTNSYSPGPEVPYTGVEEPWLSTPAPMTEFGVRMPQAPQGGSGNEEAVLAAIAQLLGGQQRPPWRSPEPVSAGFVLPGDRSFPP